MRGFRRVARMQEGHEIAKSAYAQINSACWRQAYRRLGRRLRLVTIDDALASSPKGGSLSRSLAILRFKGDLLLTIDIRTKP